jgi:hypothetical protein
MQFFTGQNIFDTLVSIGIIAFAIGQFKFGKKTRTRDDIDTENSAMELQGNKIKVLEAALEEQKTINIETGKKLAAIEAVNLEKDKTIKEYLAILQNRNPELDKVLGQILEFMKKINTHMEQDLKITGTVTH